MIHMSEPFYNVVMKHFIVRGMGSNIDAYMNRRIPKRIDLEVVPGLQVDSLQYLLIRNYMKSKLKGSKPEFGKPAYKLDHLIPESKYAGVFSNWAPFPTATYASQTDMPRMTTEDKRLFSECVKPFFDSINYSPVDATIRKDSSPGWSYFAASPKNKLDSITFASKFFRLKSDIIRRNMEHKNKYTSESTIACYGELSEHGLLGAYVMGLRRSADALGKERSGPGEGRGETVILDSSLDDPKGKNHLISLRTEFDELNKEGIDKEVIELTEYNLKGNVNTGRFRMIAADGEFAGIDNCLRKPVIDNLWKYEPAFDTGDFIEGLGLHDDVGMNDVLLFCFDVTRLDANTSTEILREGARMYDSVMPDSLKTMEYDVTLKPLVYPNQYDFQEKMGKFRVCNDPWINPYDEYNGTNAGQMTGSAYTTLGNNLDMKPVIVKSLITLTEGKLTKEELLIDYGNCPRLRIRQAGDNVICAVFDKSLHAIIHKNRDMRVDFGSIYMTLQSYLSFKGWTIAYGLSKSNKWSKEADLERLDLKSCPENTFGKGAKGWKQFPGSGVFLREMNYSSNPAYELYASVRDEAFKLFTGRTFLESIPVTDAEVDLLDRIMDSGPEVMDIFTMFAKPDAISYDESLKDRLFKSDNKDVQNLLKEFFIRIPAEFLSDVLVGKANNHPFIKNLETILKQEGSEKKSNKQITHKQKLQTMKKIKGVRNESIARQESSRFSKNDR